MELFQILQSRGGSFKECILARRGRAISVFVSFHWTAVSRRAALKDAGLLCQVKRGEKRRSASSWCWLSGFSSGAAASPSPSGPRPAPSWLGTAPLSSIRSPPPAAANDKSGEATSTMSVKLRLIMGQTYKLFQLNHSEGKIFNLQQYKKKIYSPNVHHCLCNLRVPVVLEPIPVTQRQRRA